MRTGRPIVPTTPCPVAGCTGTKKGRPYCTKHYNRFVATGDPTRTLKKGPKAKPPSRCKAEGCQEQARHAGFCGPHYRRNLAYGDPLKGGTRQGEPAAWLDAHRAHQGEECLPWPFGRGSGYRSVKISTGYTKAHRLMCRLAHGEPPFPEAEARHLCGNRDCVNPQHLAWGTPKENAADREVHGTLLKGERAPNARLTEDEVRTIRARWRGGETGKQIAKDYPVGKANVWAVATGKTWSHVQ